MRSALEESIHSALIALRDQTKHRDRGVLLGFALCCVPLLPTAILGLIISLFNYRLYKRGRLPAREKRMIQWAIGMGIVMCMISLTVFNAFHSLSPLLVLREAILSFVYQFAAFAGDLWHSITSGLFKKE